MMTVIEWCAMSTRERQWHRDVLVLRDLLQHMAANGITPVTASDLTRASAVQGHKISKTSIRRKLSVLSDGVTGIPGIVILEGPKDCFRFDVAVQKEKP